MSDGGFGFRTIREPKGSIVAPGLTRRFRDRAIRPGPNRNMPCPCGSKKKFKRCCIEL